MQRRLPRDRRVSDRSGGPMSSKAMVACSAVLMMATVSSAATIFVVPGPGTPVQDAIDAASPGDTIRLAGGDYPEKIVITKALRLRGVARPTDATQTRIDGGCTTGTVLAVAADDVRVN